MDVQPSAEPDRSTAVEKAVKPSLDIGNLLIEDQDVFSPNILTGPDDKLTALVRDDVQYLLNNVWELPAHRDHDVILATLPACTTVLPREKPMPRVQASTRWQRFAQQKGIQNRKKSRMLWDETSRSWKPRWGYKRANDATKDWLIEIPRQRDPFGDYFGERIEAKKERVAKNELKRLRNIATASGSGVRSTQQAPNALVPIESRKPEQVAHLLHKTKAATASMGKFTEPLRKEKPPKKLGKRRTFAANETPIRSEREKQLSILRNLEAKKPKLKPV